MQGLNIISPPPACSSIVGVMSEVEIVAVNNRSETSDTINSLWTLFTQGHFVVILVCI